MWKKKRQREIGFDKVEKIKEVFKFKDKELASLFDISTTQLNRYKATYTLPLTRYIAARDALLLDVEETARQEREKIMQLFNTD